MCLVSSQRVSRPVVRVTASPGELRVRLVPSDVVVRLLESDFRVDFSCFKYTSDRSPL